MTGLTKTCTKCGELKPLECFYVDRGKRDGRMSQCKACIAVHNREYYQNHTKQGEYYLIHKEKRVAYYWLNREEILQRMRTDYRAKKEKETL
jgi:hypothetical protein